MAGDLDLQRAYQDGFPLAKGGKTQGKLSPLCCSRKAELEIVTESDAGSGQSFVGVPVTQKVQLQMGPLLHILIRIPLSFSYAEGTHPRSGSKIPATNQKLIPVLG